MRKLITAINMTLDGFCDHTAGIVDNELHETFNALFEQADTAIFGRKTYQLMEEAWPAMVAHPTGNKPMDDFAVLIDNISKVVFSHTLKSVDWKNTRLAAESLEEEVKKLKQQPGKNILVGGPSLIANLTNKGLIDEYHLFVHPIILGSGLVLFKDIQHKVGLKLLGTKVLGTGVVVHHYAAAQS